MSSLVDRYIGVATRQMPEKARMDAAQDIRVMIDEMVDARVQSGEEPEAATTAVLNELGDPAKVARSFEDRPRYLIGPRYYEQYISLVKTLLTWLPITVFLALLTINVLTDNRFLVDSFVHGGLDAAWTGIVVAVQIVFWITLTFVIMEWAEPSGSEGEATADWSVADLPEELPQRQISLFEAAWGIGVMVLMATLLIVQHQRGIEAFVRNDSIRETLDGRVVSFINPQIPTWMVVATFGLILFSSVLEMVKFARGSWTLPVTIAEILSVVGFAGLPAIAMARWGLVNPEIHEIWGNDTTRWLTGSQLERIVLVVMIVISAMTIFDAVRGYRTYRRRSSEITAPGKDFVYVV